MKNLVFNKNKAFIIPYSIKLEMVFVYVRIHAYIAIGAQNRFSKTRLKPIYHKKKLLYKGVAIIQYTVDTLYGNLKKKFSVFL